MGEKKPTYTLPIQERYKIIPTRDRKFYIFDYILHTTIKDGKGKDQIIPTNKEAHECRRFLTIKYRNSLLAKEIPFTEHYKLPIR